jgi:hypothetical protein
MSHFTPPHFTPRSGRGGLVVCSVAERTLHQCADGIMTTLHGRHPTAHQPGWLVTHVLLVATFQLGHPVSVLVLMEPDDPSLHDT